MAWAKNNIASAPDGSVFLADQLEVAQGRQGRTWGIRPGQLLITIVLKPEILALLSSEDLPIRLNQLNMALALGILDPIKEYGTKLKWPNDFVIPEEQIHKKVCGMLVHLVWHEEKPLGIVFGFGMNVNTIFDTQDELSPIATSLLSYKQVHDNNTNSIDMRDLYKKLLASLDTYYSQWKQQNFSSIYTEWKNNQAFLGKPLTIHQKDGSVISGTMTQVMPNGDLMLKTDSKIMIIPFYTVEEVKV